jgi:sorbitol-specific phosphotransferase system component IIC
MLVLPMAVPFVVLLLAAVVAMLGFRRTSVWIWFIAFALATYSFQGYITDPLRIAL